jgi:3-hydroxyisobutyrate dehydrogenase/2-hydroxy-3-oxopropionate reductase
MAFGIVAAPISTLPDAGSSIGRVRPIVAVVGLGEMGSRIAARLLGAGHEVMVWNRSRQRVTPIVEKGATAVATPAEAARAAEIVITMVADPSALQAVTEGPDGVVAGVHPGLTVVQMSTVGPTATSRLARALGSRAALLDAPVLGSKAEAESGSLVIFAAGDPSLVDRLDPILKALGSVIRVGGLGAGSAAKLVANATLFNSVCALGEALALARAVGLSDDAAYEVLAATPLAAQAQRRRPAIEAGDFPRRFSLALAAKDAGLIHDAARDHSVRMPLADASRKWLTLAAEAGLGDRDYTAVLAEILGTSRERPARAGRGGWDGLIVDLDGVIWRGGDPIPGAAEAMRALRAKGVRVAYLTNEPAISRAEAAVRLNRLGIDAAPGDVITSGSAMAGVLASLHDLQRRTAYVIGPAALRSELQDGGLQIVASDSAEQAELVVVAGHQDFDYRELRAAVTAVRAGARLFATGRDPVSPTPAGPAPATGAILAAVETAAGVTATVIGKPEPAIFEIAKSALAGCTRIAVVGDSLVADIVGAHRAGLDAILVLTGNTTRDEVEASVAVPDVVLNSIADLPGAMTA